MVGDGLELLHQLPRWCRAECLTYNPIEVAERLAGDEGFAYAPLLFGYTNYSRQGYRPHRLRYIDMPVRAPGQRRPARCSVVPGWPLWRRRPRFTQAIDFAFWVAGREAQCGVYFDGGGQPGHAAAWDDDRLNAATLDFFRGTRATLEGAWMRPRQAGFVDFQDAVSPLVTACLRGDLTDDDLIAALDERARHWWTSGDREQPRLGQEVRGADH